MNIRVISQSGLKHFLGFLMETLTVMGPKERPDQPGHHHFARLNDPDEFAADYTTTTIPPKAAFFPPNEKLFSFNLSRPPLFSLMRDTFPFVLAGVHPCDLAAIDALDQAYGYPPSDVRWEANRKRVFIIGIDCLPDEYCFCTTTDTAACRSAGDLFLTPIPRGYLVEVLTIPGQKFLEKAQVAGAQRQDRQAAEQWRRDKRERMTAAFDASIDQFARMLARGGLTDVWKAVAERCYSCGSCNTTCPTCFCFNMEDDFDAGLTQGVRRRTWDSCQLADFALVAGGHNFRGDRWQRVRHRWHRKFLYLYRQFGRPYCTGCGRCSRACTADINIVDVSNRLIAASWKEHSGD
jgi:ferredoxin